MAESGPPPAVSPGNRPVEISLRCSDLKASVHFYGDLLGLPLTHADPHEGDEVEHFEVSWGEPGKNDFFMMILWPAAIGQHTSNAYVGFATDNLQALNRRLLDAGVTVVLPPTQKPWGWCAEYRDPDGNTVFVNG